MLLAKRLPFVGAVLLLLTVSGCYNYPPPPASTMGVTYSARKMDKADELLQGITVLTLADAQRLAVTNNPTLISAAQAVFAARMRYYQAIGAYSPTISANFGLSDSHSRNRNTTNTSSTPWSENFSTSVGVTANWVLFDGLAREFNYLIAQTNKDYQKNVEDNQIRTTMLAVAYAYNAVLLAIENKRIAFEDRAFQQLTLEDTKLKFEAGTVPKSDVLNFEIAANNAESALVSADYDYEVAIYALAVLMGYPEGTLPASITFPECFKTEFVDLPAVEIYLDTALANRPDLKAYRDQVEVARYSMYQTVSARIPTVSAYGRLGYGTSLSRSHHSTPRHTYSESPSVSYGLNVDWQIFSGFSQYNKFREYKANLVIAEYAVTENWLTVVEEVRSAYSNYIQAVKQTQIFSRNRDLSAQQRDLVDEGYRAGNTELTRLNEAQTDLVTAEANLASSYINVQNAKAQLDAAVFLTKGDYYRNAGTPLDNCDSDQRIPGLGDGSRLPEGVTQSTPPEAPDTSVIPGSQGPGAVNSDFPATPADLDQNIADPVVNVQQ